jgi:uncharacterized protein YukE
MAGREQKYNVEHMEEISLHYKQCSDSASLAINNIDSAKVSFLTNYKGQSDDTALELYDKIKEHMELLRDSLTQMQNYVTYTKETMVAADMSVSE